MDDFFGRHKFLGVGILKIVPILSSLPRVASMEKKSREILTLYRPEVIESNTLNFRPDF